MTTPEENKPLDSAGPVEEAAPRADRLLTDDEQMRILDLAKYAIPKEVAAHAVGVNDDFVALTAEEDVSFRDLLNEAPAKFEANLVGRVEEASHKAWQAGAWLLERVFPNRYARRKPDVLTLDQLDAFMARVYRLIEKGVSDAKERDELIRKLQQMHKPDSPRETEAS